MLFVWLRDTTLLQCISGVGLHERICSNVNVKFGGERYLINVKIHNSWNCLFSVFQPSAKYGLVPRSVYLN